MKPLRTLVAAGAALLVTGAPRTQAPPAWSGGARPGPLLAPVVRAVVTQPFGCTRLAIEPIARWCPGGHFHTGIDLAAPYGSRVRAAAAGRARVGLDPAGYGRYVLVDDGGGLTTLYGHLSSTSLASGEEVAPGQEIGRVGSSGLATGPHLHFEVRRDGRPVDPSPYLVSGWPSAVRDLQPTARR